MFTKLHTSSKLFFLFFCGILTNVPTLEAQQIVIEQLRDISFGQVAPTAGNLEASTSFCVALNQQAQYQVIATSDSDRFEVRNGPSALAYSVFFSDRRSMRNLQQLHYGVPLGRLKARGNFSGFCRRANAHVQVRINGTDLQSSDSGAYFGTLILTVSPE